MKMFLLFFQNVFILPKMIDAQQHPHQQNYFLSDRVEGLDAARIIGTPRVKCNTKWLTLDLETNVPFQGRIYVNGKAFDRRCSAQFILNQMPNATVQIPIIDCANLEELNKSSDKKEMIFVTKTSQVFRAECTEVSGLDYRDEDKRIGPANTICTHDISQFKNSRATEKDRIMSSRESLTTPKFLIGEHVWHKWHCSNDFSMKRYAVLLRNCEAMSRSKQVVQLLDQTGCIVDDQLMNNLKMADEKDKTSKEGSHLVAIAESDMFKFLEEKEVRFKCSLLLIPRSLNNSPVELPKCSVTKEELMKKAAANITDLFQFINPHKRFKEVIETITLTKWIKVNEQLAITNYDKVFPTPTTLIETQFDPQEQKKGSFVQSAAHSVEGSIHKTAPISKIAFDDGLNNDFFEYQDGDLMSSANLNANEQRLYQLRNSKVSKAITENNKSAAKQTNFNKKDWLLENLLLNGTNTSEKIIKDLPKHSGCAVAGSNASILINKLRNKLSEKHMCSWRVLNSAILVWSIASVLVWLALLTRALYKYSYQSRESCLQSLTSTTSPTSNTNVSSTTALSTAQPLSRWQRNVNMGKLIPNTQNRSPEGGDFRPTYGRFSSLRMD